MSATEFEAKCLDPPDQVEAQRIGRLENAKRGKVVTVRVPPVTGAVAAGELHGCLRGSVHVPAGVDLTAPVLGQA